MRGHRRDLGLVGPLGALDEVRVAIAKERSAGLRATDVRVLEVHASDGEEGSLWELYVEADDPLPDAREWAGATMRRDLLAVDGGAGTWRAQVLDVDPPSGRVFVEGPRPTEGLAVVWPYDFLASLWEMLQSGRYLPLHDD